ncbi:hypothetical protein SEA_ARACELI_76 [Streptomyces phage Araceli]|nr:hypothetical protein SEA_HENOCCUS_77 [Streptomyces phage Henoccus]QFG07890.1 hypothetical protein SEA_ARACELI_76 [Streptomyces phage Araceli]
MKRAECKTGMLVRDTRSRRAYRVDGERVYATDCGAWVRDLHENSDGVRDGGVIHWSFLEPLKPEDWITVRYHEASGYRVETAELIQGHATTDGKGWWRVQLHDMTVDGPASGGPNTIGNYERYVRSWLRTHHPELAAWLDGRESNRG